MIIREIPVMHQRFIQANERMGSSRMPDASFCGITLVGDPCMSLEVLELIVLHILLGVSDKLKNQDISAVGEDKSPLLSKRSIERIIKLVGIAPDKLILEVARRETLEPVSYRERFQNIGALRGRRIDEHQAGGLPARECRDSHQCGLASWKGRC